MRKLKKAYGNKKAPKMTLHHTEEYSDKTQIVAKPKNSNSDKTPKVKL